MTGRENGLQTADLPDCQWFLGTTDRENWLRTVELRNPEWIPCQITISLATWHQHKEKLGNLVLDHPLIFKDYKKGSINFDEFPPRQREGEYYWDNWGSLWYNVQAGIQGQVVKHPLADWKALDTYKMPDPLKEYDGTTGEYRNRDWGRVKKRFEERRKKGFLTQAFGGCLFDRLYYLRGFENLMIDFATDAPQVSRLIDMLLENEMRLIGKWLKIGVDVIIFHTDIGMQNSLMISPDMFRRYIKPMFKEIFATCRKGGAYVYLSSDGRLLEIVDDLIECGVSIHDPQLGANTLDGIVKAYKGKMCVNLDLDRQSFSFCTPEDIRRQVKEVVEKLGSPKGGLMVWGSTQGGDVPLQNIEALCKAMEEYCLKGRK